jgi:hypothetical protein
MRNATRFVLVTLALALAGCAQRSSEHRPVSTMSEAQRDSAIARSQIPGAHAVAKAFQFAEKTSRATVDPDSLEH